jgi:ABC-2 type transport system ATP-binding protein
MISTVDVRQLEHRLGDFRLGPLTFALVPGVTGLIGANGAGKTTLLRKLATLLPSEAGSLTVLGEDLQSRRSRAAVRRHIGYLPQHVDQPRNATCRQVLHHAAWVRDVPKQRRTRRVDDVLAMVDLVDAADSTVGQLSGGMARRLAFGQAIVHQPRFLLLDEPTASLDPQQRLLFRDQLRSLPPDTTVILSSHLAEDVRSLASRVLVLNRGGIVFDDNVPALEGLADGSRPGESLLEQGMAAVLADRPVGGLR